MAGIACLLRALAWQVPPVFTDDLYRYRWEGRIQQTGANPYALRPRDTESLPGDERIPGRDFKAVYGPMVLGVERATYRFAGEDIRLWRIPAALADLATAALLALALRRRGRPMIQALLYAWCPLPTCEFWSNGHNDAWLLASLAAALAFRAEASWFALGLATLTKWWPAMLIALWPERGLKQAFAFLLPVFAAMAFYWTNARENAAFASGFVGGWRNNDLLFGGLLALTADQYRAKYLAFGLLAIVIALLARRRNGGLWAVVALLALSANIHPWYLTWLLPFLVFEPRPGLLLWLALAPLLHEAAVGWRIAGEWTGVSAGRWLVHGPALVLVVLGLWGWPNAGRMEQKDS